MSCFAVRLSGSVPSFKRLFTGGQSSLVFPCLRVKTFNVQRNYAAVKPPCLLSSWKSLSSGRAEFGSQRVSLLGQQKIYVPQNRIFHTSPRNDIPPVLLLLIKPAAKMASIISGRTFRKWWQGLTPEKRQYYKDHVFRRKTTIAAALGLLVLASFVHYFTHLQTTPITNRRRYVAFTSEQFLKIAQFEYEMELKQVEKQIVPHTHPAYQKVVRVVQRIINGNQDLDFLQRQDWTVIVVNSEDANAAVLPTGHIFVNTGLLKMTENDDQLAVVLGHEIAHALLSHGAEHVSFATVLDIVIILAMAAIWAVMPSDGLAIVTDWFYNRVIQLLLQLPYSRKLELEADEVGLQLIAKACFDIRESTVFWAAMFVQNELKDNIEIPEWISTHPANLLRAEKLDELIPKAIQQRESCKCPELSAKDPRNQLTEFLRLLNEKKNSQQSNVKIDRSLPIVKPPVAIKTN